MPHENNRELIIRTYRPGLGDCFLLSFPRATEPGFFHLLIDCGALNSKHYDAERMKAVVRDIREKTDGRLDAVVATHEHWDHISGFLQAEDIFSSIEVGRVWAAWTEEPENEAARALKKQFKKNKEAVEMALDRIPETEKNRRFGAYKQAITHLFGFFGGLGAAAAGNTERAWKNYLGLSRKKVYCNPKKPPLTLDDSVPDVKVYILGPPDDPDFVKKKLSKIETYDESGHGFAAFNGFAAAFSDEDGIEERAFPFDERYRVLTETARENPFFKKHYGFGKNGAGDWRKIDYDWLSQAGQLALHLDSYTNNTCLAMAIELGEEGQVLLFPGDAQVGNWLSWNELSWKTTDADGKIREVRIDDLLARTVFYKVGHHGSHNATMRAKGLEKMISPELVAMIPVHRKTAEDQKWEFPYAPLWQRLRERCGGRVLLADATDLDEIRDDAQQRLSAEDWQKFEDRLSFEDLFIEFRVNF